MPQIMEKHNFHCFHANKNQNFTAVNILFIVSDLNRLVTSEHSFGSLHHQQHLLGLLPHCSPAAACYNISCPSSDLSSVLGCTYFGREVGVCLCATGAGGGGFTVYCSQIELLSCISALLISLVSLVDVCGGSNKHWLWIWCAL